jgi:hypothetical protein
MNTIIEHNQDHRSQKIKQQYDYMNLGTVSVLQHAIKKLLLKYGHTNML